MSIRIATIEDAEAIYAIEQNTFSVPWSLASIEQELEESQRTLYYVIEEDDKVVAYGGAWMVADEGQITNIAVLEDYRRDGNGIMLVRKLVKELFRRGMTEVFLEVRMSNIPAISLYRRLGFTVKGYRKNYYTEPVEDAYIMSIQKEESET